MYFNLIYPNGHTRGNPDNRNSKGLLGMIYNDCPQSNKQTKLTRQNLESKA